MQDTFLSGTDSYVYHAAIHTYIKKYLTREV